MSKKTSCLVILFFILLNQTHAQDFASALSNFHQSYPQEKIYVHFDKDNYVAGETIWFKAYLFNNGMPSVLSSNFYVQLSDADGKIIETKKYPVYGAAVNGHIDLPDSLLQASYLISAYTPSSLNFTDADLLYRKAFYIYNRNTSKPVSASPETVDLVFFPESGHLVHGITTVLAFKATDQRGRPVDVNGMIKTPDGFTIPFKSIHDGMGKVNFRPDASKSYTASVTGIAREYKLPPVEKSGILLHVEDEKEGKAFTITRSNADRNNFQKVFVVAQINEQVVYEQDIDFEDYPSLKGHLVTSKLPSGILQFTVFNKDGAPLAERLSFVDNREYLAPTSATSINTNLQKRAENIIEIVDHDSLQKSLSVSITDVSVKDPADRESIISRFLLTSDLKGHVYNAAWYFEKPVDSVKMVLDNLMLTHGWTRFKWEKILDGQLPEKKFADPYLLTVRGQIKDESGKDARAGELNLYIESEDSTTQSYDVDVDAAGRFVLDTLLFYGKSKFYYTYFQNGRQKKASVVLDSINTDPVLSSLPINSLPFSMIQMSQSEVSKRYLFHKEVLDRSKQLEPIVLEAKSDKKPIDIINEKYTTGAFRTPAKVSLDNINQPTPNKMINPLDFAMNNIRLLEMQNGRLVNNRTLSLQSGAKWNVAVFLDETPTELSALRSYRMDEIALIKFYEPGFVGAGSNGPGGALAIYTKHARQDQPKSLMMDYVTYNGYSITKEFYNPDYSKHEPRHDLEDRRSTLYWNPKVFLDADNLKTEIRFFNNDYSKKLKMVIEGFSADGKLIHIEKIIE